MINLKKNAILVIGGGICLVMLIGVVVALMSSMGEYNRVASDKRQAESRLRQLNERDPYPSPENIDETRRNRDILNEQLTTLMLELRRQEFTIDPIEPAQFAPMMERGYNRVAELAAEANVIIPDRLQFGFDQYARGTLPTPSHIPRLVRQLKTIEYISGILIQARVNELASIQRVKFEAQPDEDEGDASTRAGRGGRGARPAASPASSGGGGPVPAIERSKLYVTERVQVVFTGREPAVWEALNQLAASPIFIQISDLAVENLARDIGRPVDLRAQAQAAARVTTMTTPGARAMAVAGEIQLADIPRDERIVGGRELVQASVVLDIYTFPEDSTLDEEETL